jgi:hypothetical protein
MGFNLALYHLVVDGYSPTQVTAAYTDALKSILGNQFAELYCPPVRDMQKKFVKKFLDLFRINNMTPDNVTLVRGPDDDDQSKQDK